MVKLTLRQFHKISFRTDKIKTLMAELVFPARAKEELEDFKSKASLFHDEFPWANVRNDLDKVDGFEATKFETARKNGRSRGRKHYLTILYWLYNGNPESVEKKQCQEVADKICNELFECSIEEHYRENISALETGLHPREQGFFNQSKSSNLPSNNPIFARRMLRMESDIGLRLADYEASAVEEEFDQFVADNESGFWLLTAGPGMGKSTIMASLFSRHSKHNACCSYFFRFGIDDPNHNTLGRFYEYVFCWLEQRYCIEKMKLSDSNKINGELLQGALFQLHEAGEISDENPFFLIVDALDEIAGGISSAKVRRNPLDLQVELPKGVFIAYSARVTDQNDSPFQGIKFKPYHNQNSTLGDSKAHQRTVERYTKRICQKADYITEYHNAVAQTGGVRLASKYVFDMCKNANYNFMIVRCYLLDASWWRNGGKASTIPGQIEDFFQQNFERMIEADSDGTAARAILSCVVRPRLSFYNYCRLNDMMHGSLKIDSILNVWLAQGLVIRSHDGRNYWLHIYHMSYLLFLQRKLAEQDQITLFGPMLDNLLSHGQTDTIIAQMHKGKEPPDLTDEWIELVLDIAKRKRDIFSIKSCLYSLEFWQIAAKGEGGLMTIIKHISVWSAGNYHLDDIEDLFKRLCVFLKKWLDNGEIKKTRKFPGDNAKSKRGHFTLREVVEMIAQSGKTGLAGRSTVYLVDYFD